MEHDKKQIILGDLNKQEESKLKNIYYLIWADSILSYKKYHPKNKNWKINVFIMNTYINSLTLFIIILWLKYYKVLIVPDFSIDIFPGTLIDGILHFTIVFALPFVLPNYFFIFHNDRYKRIIKKYPHPPKNLALIYSISIVLGAFFSALLYGALS